MNRFTVIEKKVGETPFSALEVFRAGDEKLSELPLTYAGRLDPMASGKLLILIGDECKNRKKYDDLDKEYEFEILFGFKTDTGDVLGLAQADNKNQAINEKDLVRVAQTFLGKKRFPYPAFSSKTVLGKPLFHHAIENNLGQIEIPKADIEIYNLKLSSIYKISGKLLIENIEKKISLLDPGPETDKVGNGFRKEEILEKWKSFGDVSAQEFTVAKFKIITSSGSYIRTIAPLIAEKLGTFGLAYSIHRAKIGHYKSLIKNFGFWRRTFV
ncbi:MAG: hypothetical protein V4467_05025 [Patescibacteria group bacterium]